MVGVDPVRAEEVFETPDFFNGGVALVCCAGEDLFEAENFLFESFDVELFAFAMRPALLLVKKWEH